MNYNDYFYKLSDFPYLGAVPDEIATLNVLELPKNATTVHIVKPYKNFNEIVHFKKIERLALQQLTSEWVDLLTQLPNLKYLALSQCKKTTELPDISSLKRLEVLVITRCNQLTSLNFLKNCKNLKSLCISECKLITDLSPLQNLAPSLKELWIDGSIASSPQKVKSIEPIGKLKKLEFLHFMLRIERTNNSLNPLLNLKELKHLTIRHIGYKKMEFAPLVEQLDGLNDIYFNAGLKWSTIKTE